MSRRYPNLTALATLILFFLCAFAQAQTTTFTPNCTGTAATDTSRIQTLITQIGSNTGNIRIPYKATLLSRCTVNTMTIPTNISLDNTDGTGIVVGAGQTLTVLGPRINPAGKTMFFGPGTTIATGSTNTTGAGTISVSSTNDASAANHTHA